MVKIVSETAQVELKSGRVKAPARFLTSSASAVTVVVSSLPLIKFE